MAIQIIPRQGLASLLGEGFERGLETGLKQLAANQMQNLQRRNLASSLQSLGFTPEQSAATSFLPQPVQQEVLKQTIPEKFGRPTAAQQTRIEAENKPFLQTFNQQFETAKSLTDLANSALELINTGKTPEGVQGFLPTEFLSEEGQRLDNIYNNIVRIIAAQEKGPLTKSRIALAQSTKPFFRQKRSVQKKLLEDLASKANPVLTKKQIEQQLIERNRGFQPAGLQGKIEKQYRLQTFGNPTDYEADTVVNLDGVRYKPSKDGTDWVPA